MSRRMTTRSVTRQQQAEEEEEEERPKQQRVRGSGNGNGNHRHARQHAMRHRITTILISSDDEEEEEEYGNDKLKPRRCARLQNKRHARYHATDPYNDPNFISSSEEDEQQDAQSKSKSKSKSKSTTSKSGTSNKSNKSNKSNNSRKSSKNNNHGSRNRYNTRHNNDDNSNDENKDNSSENENDNHTPIKTRTKRALNQRAKELGTPPNKRGKSIKNRNNNNSPSHLLADGLDRLKLSYNDGRNKRQSGKSGHNHQQNGRITSSLGSLSMNGGHGKSAKTTSNGYHDSNNDDNDDDDISNSNSNSESQSKSKSKNDGRKKYNASNNSNNNNNNSNDKRRKNMKNNKNQKRESNYCNNDDGWNDNESNNDFKTKENNNNNNSNNNNNNSMYDKNEEIRMNIIKMKEMLLTQEFNFELKGRDIEYNKIWNFFITHLKYGKGGSFYICGSPGTGKSATILNIENELKNNNNIKSKYNISLIFKINAMHLPNPQYIYHTLYEKCFNTNIIPSSTQILIEKLKNYFLNKNDKSMKIVIIDEMDGLLQSNPVVLYHLFEWCKNSNNNDSRLLLIGIANSIDLTDRFLPKLQRRQAEPIKLIFEAYTKQQLLEILQYRLSIIKQQKNNNSNDNNNNNNNNMLLLFPEFDNIALQLCAQKVAKMYGDVRKCLEICRACLDSLLTKIEIELMNHSNNSNNEIENDISKKISLKIGFLEMNKILKESFGSPIIEIIKNLPNHQRIVLVIATLLSKYNETNNIQTPFVTYNKLERFYQYMAKKYSLPMTSSREFHVIIDSLITDGLLSVAIQKSYGHSNNHKNGNDSRLQILVPIDDITFAVQDNPVLTKFLQANFVVPPKYR